MTGAKFIVPAALFAKIIASPNIKDPNVPVKQGSPATALHVASETGRADIGGLMADLENRS